MNQIEKAGTSEIYFFDTYAFFEIIKGNPAYQQFVSVNCITTIFNLAELNYNLKKEKDKETADAITEKYKYMIVEATIEDIKKAMDLKTEFRDLSIPDAVGYIVAKRYKAKFLTGDSGFKDMKNVTFIK